jgi:hypothetical protein
MREFKLIEDAISKFSLDLRGLTVLTEAASGNYLWTAIIAALAGADVFAFSKDSKYASFRDVKENTQKIAKDLGIIHNVKIINEIKNQVLNSADIITNTGFLRPLNKEKLQYCKKNVVIPLMYETWEFRASDIDMIYCKENHIPILGTNESDLRLETIKYLGLVVKKALLINNIEVLKSKIIILGFGKFANAIHDSLKPEVDFIEIWNTKKNIQDLSSIDAIIVADHQTEIQYIGSDGVLIPSVIKKENPNLLIVHISGNIDFNLVKQNALRVFPEQIAAPKNMSLTTDFTGPKPVIDLHSAGLKVGELYCRSYAKYGDQDIALQNCLKDALVQVL